MNYFESIFAECFDIEWMDCKNTCDTITLYDNGKAILLDEFSTGPIIVGTSLIPNIFVLPDAIIEILTSVGKVTVRDDGKLLTEQKIEL